MKVRMFPVLKPAGLFITISICFLIKLHSASAVISNNNPLEPANPLPYALSPAYLTFLAKQERTMYKAMKDYTKELEKRLKLLNRYTTDYEESSLKAIHHIATGSEDDMQDEVVASNPILAFRMLSRYANEFTEVGQHIGENAEEASSDIVIRAKGVYDFPSHLDSRDALQGILRLQFMYDLDALSIAEGRLPGVKKPIGLTTNQCYHFAKSAQTNKLFTLAMDWFNVTKSKYSFDLNKSAYSWDEKRLEADIDHTILKHDREFTLNFEEKYEYSFADQLQSSEAPRPETLRSKLLEEFRGVHLHEDDPDYFQAIYINHVEICNGANFQKGPDDPEPNSKGDRVTTFLAYLNNVEHGGRTSFPKLGFGVDPIKGSAILWYTNLKNGAIDPDTLHAACPLISGQKWIATKWTHINENILKRPCDRNPAH